jgi:hypothetical protein
MENETTPAPLVIQCLYCGESLTLHQDSAESRAAKADPWQQMRRHIVEHHLGDLAMHQCRAGWLTDMLFFHCPTNPDAWRANIQTMIAATERIILAGLRGEQPE